MQSRQLTKSRYDLGAISHDRSPTATRNGLSGHGWHGIDLELRRVSRFLPRAFERSFSYGDFSPVNTALAELTTAVGYKNYFTCNER